MSNDDGIDSFHNWFAEHGIAEVECLVPDITGEAKGKIIPVGQYTGGELPRLPESIFAQTLTGDYPEDEAQAIDPVELDMELTPDPATCRLVPWTRKPTAQVIHDCRFLDNRPVETSPRHVLRQVLARYTQRGLRPIAAPEMEFYLLEPNTDAQVELQPPVGRGGRRESSQRAFSIDAVREYDALLADLYSACAIQELGIDTLIHEEGTSQLEVNFKHGDPLDLADQVFMFKRTLRETALAHGMYATFMAKPMAAQPGSSMHIHQSLVDATTGDNVFAQGEDGLSPLLYQYIGGLQTYVPQALALLAPNVNSYRRLLPDESNTSAPFNVEWGFDNRTVGLRVPRSGGKGRRVENRIAGADANPYLAMATTLACGMLGMDEGLESRGYVTESAVEQGHCLPADLGRALDALDGCKELKTSLGEQFVKTYLAVKRCEARAHFRVVSAWEREYLLLRV